ncbi:homeobox domain protein, partial [Opisthorchis viverrini]
MSCARCFQPQQLFTIDAILASECKSDKILNKEVRQRHLGLCTSMCNELPINPDVSSHLHPVSSYWSQQISKSLPTDLEVKAAVTPPTSPADIGSYDKGDSLPRLHTLKSVKSRSPRIPFTKIQVDALETKFQQTHYLSGMEVYQLSSKLSLAEN